jgi:hypothetical protein
LKGEYGEPGEMVSFWSSRALSVRLESQIVKLSSIPYMMTEHSKL